MKFRKLSMLILSVLLFSCGIHTYSTFPIDKVHLGTNKARVINICGRPFRADAYINAGKKTEVLYYKEPAKILNQGFIITTTLIFENDSLTSIKQDDKNISNIELSLDSIKRK